MEHCFVFGTYAWFVYFLFHLW